MKKVKILLSAFFLILICTSCGSDSSSSSGGSSSFQIEKPVIKCGSDIPNCKS